MSSPEHKQKIWNLIKDLKVGMLVTEDDQDLRGRPMTLVQDAYDGTLWFFTRRDSDKVDDIQEDRKVCLTFSNSNEGIHVSLSGKAKLTQDSALINRYWNPYVEAYYKNGKDDPEVAMLEIKIYQGEHWKADDNNVVELFEIAKANVMNSTPDVGENEKFG